MADLDRGGTFRPSARVYMGPSVGWVTQPQAILRATSGTTIQMELGNLVVAISTTAPVTVQLPKFRGSNAGAGAVPGSFSQQTVTIIDYSGGPNVTIVPFAGETISSLSSIPLTTPFGAFVLEPDPVNGGSTVVS